MQPQDGYSICLFSAVVFKEKNNNRICWWEGSNEGKNQWCRQSSKNYLMHGPGLACWLFFFFFFLTVDYFYSPWVNSDFYISKWLQKIKRKIIFHEIRKLCQIQISVSTNKALLESNHTQHILTVYDCFCSTMTELSCCGKRLYVTFYWFPLLHRALWITMIEL